MSFNSQTKNELKKIFQAGCEELKLEISTAVEEKIIQYLELLVKWNQAYNLTAIRDPILMMTRHILDSLSVIPYIEGQRIIDVGTGAGFPGIPIALIYPQKQVTLLDSNGKKTRFLIQIKGQLDLNNIEIVQARAEEYQPTECFNEVIARAFTDLNDMISKTKHLCCQNGRIWAMKGIYPQEEISKIKNVHIDVFPLTVPGLQEQRHLIRITEFSCG